MVIKAKASIHESAQRLAAKRNVFAGTHGTTMFDPDSTYVEPNVKGHKPVFDFSEKNRAYFTSMPPGGGLPDTGQYYAGGDPERDAWAWAGEASITKGRGNGYRERPVVHSVVPEGSIEADKHFTFSGETVQFTADRLRITDTHWTPPPDHGEGSVQGTFPHVNWNQFGPKYTETWSAPELNFQRNRMPAHDYDEWTGKRLPAKWPNPDEPSVKGPRDRPEIDHRQGRLFGQSPGGRSFEYGERPGTVGKKLW